MFTGHSLGGALATLASARTVLSDLRSSNNVISYTFGEPRVGNFKFATNYNKLIPHRLFHF